MENRSDKNALDSKLFSYRQYKNGKVSIFWNEKEITTLKGKKAEKFSVQIEDATEFEAQMIMAKITGNFKHGNERVAKLKSK